MVVKTKEDANMMHKIRDSWPNKLKNFRKKISMPDENGCTFWERGTDKDGYGICQFTWGNEIYKRAHRVAYFIENGPFDQTLLVCHSCDNPGCVNPDHLFLGTHSDNMKDKHSKGWVNPFQGREHSPETKKMMSDKAKGRSHTPETKQKLRDIADSKARRKDGTFIK